MRLGHLSRTASLTTYPHGLDIQNRLIERHVEYKARIANTSTRLSSNEDGRRYLSPSLSTPVPDPTILTLQHQPVYTVGRRELGRIPISQRQYLIDHGRAVFHESPRGGQITFHGPGQLVAYPIIDLRRHGLTPRAYVRLLETCVINAIARFGLKTITTDNPGVWLPGGQKKVASLGVNVRRGVTGHGVAINVEDRRGYLGWGFGRIVACGLEGKEVTWLDREGGEVNDDHNDIGNEVDVLDVESAFVMEFAKQIAVQKTNIYKIPRGWEKDDGVSD